MVISECAFRTKSALPGFKSELVGGEQTRVWHEHRHYWGGGHRLDSNDLEGMLLVGGAFPSRVVAARPVGVGAAPVVPPSP